MLRALRAIRVVRTFRRFEELHFMVLALVRSVRPLLWAMFFIGVTTSVFDVFLLQVVCGHLESAVEGDPLIEPILANYKSFWRLFLALFESVTGGQDWGPVVEPIWSISYVSGVIFVFYVIIMVFVVFNVVTGIFCETAFGIASKNHTECIQEEQERMDDTMNKFAQFFKNLDTSDAGVITREAFNRYANDRVVRANFSTLGIEFGVADEVFSACDAGHNGEVDIEEFIIGCMRIQGGAKGIDLFTLKCEINRLLHWLSTKSKSDTARWNRLEQLCALQANAVQSIATDLNAGAVFI